jgi:DnaK suppressor protein
MSEFTNESVAQIESTLDDVDRALERLRQGTYRTCQVCGSAIDDAALEADPLPANCIAHPKLV